MTRYSVPLDTEAFEAVWDGRRPFDVMTAALGAQPGDSLTMVELLPKLGILSGRSIDAVVTYISREIGDSGLCVAGLRIVTKVENPLCRD